MRFSSIFGKIGIVSGKKARFRIQKLSGANEIAQKRRKNAEKQQKAIDFFALIR